jgi:hypothetical protein
MWFLSEDAHISQAIRILWIFGETKHTMLIIINVSPATNSSWYVCQICAFLTPRESFLYKKIVLVYSWRHLGRHCATLLQNVLNKYDSLHLVPNWSYLPPLPMLFSFLHPWEIEKNIFFSFVSLFCRLEHRYATQCVTILGILCRQLWNSSWLPSGSVYAQTRIAGPQLSWKGLFIWCSGFLW